MSNILHTNTQSCKPRIRCTTQAEGEQDGGEGSYHTYQLLEASHHTEQQVKGRFPNLSSMHLALPKTHSL